MKEPKPGSALISDPFLQDPNFMRTVVFLTEHNDHGTLGFVVNQPTDIRLNKLLKDESLPAAMVYQGGPVELNTLHFLHNLGQVVPDSLQLGRGIWWGGDINEALRLLRLNPELEEHMHFYLGYSGWGEGQLRSELDDEAWVVSDIEADEIFSPQEDSLWLWKKLIDKLGGKYRHLSNAPIDPQLN